MSYRPFSFSLLTLQNSSNIFYLPYLSDSLYRCLISFKYSDFTLLLIIIPFYLFNITVTLFMKQRLFFLSMVILFMKQSGCLSFQSAFSFYFKLNLSSLNFYISKINRKKRYEHNRNSRKKSKKN